MVDYKNETVDLEYDMKISIAMATYNGANWIMEQLESFNDQTTLPDELVICDDCSTDETVELLYEFKKKSLFKVNIHVNAENIGYTRNFEKALSLCNGDLIFLSDQDDVWFACKIDTVSRIFELNSKIHVLVNDMEITDAQLTSTGKTYFENTFSLGFKRNRLITGCCTAMTSDFKDLLLPFPTDLLVHDGWIHLLSNYLEVRMVLPKVLQNYRRHESNVSSPAAVQTNINVVRRWLYIFRNGVKDSSVYWKNDVAISCFIFNRLKSRELWLKTQSLSSIAREIMQSQKLRSEVLMKRMEIVKMGRLRRVLAVFRLLHEGKYRYFSGIKSAVKDAIF